MKGSCSSCFVVFMNKLTNSFMNYADVYKYNEIGRKYISTLLFNQRTQITWKMSLHSQNWLEAKNSASFFKHANQNPFGKAQLRNGWEMSLWNRAK